MKHLTDQEIAYAAALLEGILTDYHGSLTLLKIDDERLAQLAKLLRAKISGPVLNTILVALRKADQTWKAKKGRDINLARDPEHYHRIGKLGGRPKKRRESPAPKPAK